MSDAGPDPASPGRELARVRTHVASLRARASGGRVAAEVLLGESLAALDALVDRVESREDARAARDDALADYAREMEASGAHYRELFDEAPDAYVVIDAGGHVREANVAALRLFGRAEDEVLGKLLVVFVPVADRLRFRTRLADVVRGEPITGWPVRIRRGDGSVRDMSCSAEVTRLGEGEVQIRWTMRDVPTWKVLEERAGVLERIVDGFVALDAQGRFTYVNGGAEKVLGCPRARLLGRSVWEVFPEAVDGRLFQLYGDVMRRGEPRHLVETVPALGRSFELHLYPGDGLSVYFHDVTDRRRSELALRRAKETAEAAVLHREAILASVSHDLKNPIQAIQLQSSLLANSRAAIRRDAAVHIDRVTGMMSRLVDGLLDFGRLETGHALAVEMEDVVVATLLTDACMLFAPQVADKRLALECGPTPDCPARVRADPHRLLQVLWNVVGNAVKFCAPGGRIGVTAHRAGDGVRFAVRDTGRGIPAEHLPHLFEPYWQADATARLGTGIGLSISKALVEAHGGSIEVRSTVGVGTTVSFTLPTASP